MGRWRRPVLVLAVATALASFVGVFRERTPVAWSELALRPGTRPRLTSPLCSRVAIIWLKGIPREAHNDSSLLPFLTETSRRGQSGALAIDPRYRDIQAWNGAPPWMASVRQLLAGHASVADSLPKIAAEDGNPVRVVTCNRPSDWDVDRAAVARSRARLHFLAVDASAKSGQTLRSSTGAAAGAHAKDILEWDRAFRRWAMVAGSNTAYLVVSDPGGDAPVGHYTLAGPSVPVDNAHRDLHCRDLPSLVAALLGYRAPSWGWAAGDVTHLTWTEAEIASRAEDAGNRERLVADWSEKLETGGVRDPDDLVAALEVRSRRRNAMIAAFWISVCTGILVSGRRS